MSNTEIKKRGLRAAAIAFVLTVGLALPASVEASPITYRFSLAANGAVGPIDITWTVASFVPNGALIVTNLSSPTISFTTGTPIIAGSSVIGFDQDPSETLFGVSLVDAAGIVLLNFNHPADFFRFTRLFDQEGVFSSTSGLVQSQYSLGSTTPTATLCVSSTDGCVAAVPEPGTFLLLGTGAAVLALRRRLKANA